MNTAIGVAKVFNTQLEQFVTELRTLYPNDSDFGVFLTAVQHMKSYTPRKPVELFTEFVAGPYRAQIQERSESFFLSKDYSSELGGDFDFVPKLKQYWAGMSKDSQEAAWKYLTLLLALADRYAGMSE